jgi:2-hydroxychromene-2-carboxylate isomerase
MADPRLTVVAAGGAPATAAPEQADRPVFYYDLASPEAYLAAERVNAVLPVVPEWQPILLAELEGGEELDAWRCEAERDSVMEDVARRAARRGLQPVRWPATWPGDTRLAMLAATYARGIGRAVAYSLAAFRQAFAAGRDLSDPDSVAIAAAACELHPAAVLKAVEMRSTREALRAATDAAGRAGVRTVPTIGVGGRLYVGEAAVEQAGRDAA